MPEVNIKFKDDADLKSFMIDCDLDLYPGKPLSPAQAAAAEIMKRTKGVWHITASSTSADKRQHDSNTCPGAICQHSNSNETVQS